MAQDPNDIYTIVERLRVLEEGLDKNQRRVNQLGATFKPQTAAVLTAKQDPKNPMAGKLVGSCEESADPVLEADVSEDILEKVKNSFQDFIKSVEDKIQDTDIKDKTTRDSDIKAKDTKDRAFVAKSQPVAEQGELDSALSGVVPAAQPAGEPGVSMKEAAPVKTFTLEDGTCLECYGDKTQGFEIRRGGQAMPSRFKNLDDADMAFEMFQHRRRKQNDTQDYIEEK